MSSDFYIKSTKADRTTKKKQELTKGQTKASPKKETDSSKNRQKLIDGRSEETTGDLFAPCSRPLTFLPTHLGPYETARCNANHAFITPLFGYAI